ncbi:MAG: hypothetical protein P1V81_09245 [Planctomycetota bacterium]|nr:hypothetical protein [Planctomycetota bacterium]
MLLSLLLTVTPALLGDGEVRANPPALAPAAQVAPCESLADAPLAAWRLRLLDLAYGAASAMPLEPHVKNRSRAQEGVLVDCLELGLLGTAERFADGIANWRRGAALADLAYRSLESERESDAAHVQRLLDAAQVSLQEQSSDEAQGWRRDRIATKMARVLVQLGELEAAQRLTLGATESELGRVQSELASGLDPEQLGAFRAEVARVVEVGVFEQVQAYLAICVQLHARFYGDAEERARLEQLVAASWTKMPVDLRVRWQLGLGTNALDAGDGESARRLLGQAADLFDDFEWRQARHELPLLADLGRAWVRAGRVEQARALVVRGLARFEAESPRIADIFQAETLRPFAEVLFLMGDREAARELFARVLEVGRQNPNGRPRAEDLAETCRSMARVGCEPTPELWSALVECYAELGAPW